MPYSSPWANGIYLQNKYKTELAEIDREAGTRAIRNITLAAAKKEDITGEDYAILQEYENRAESLRKEIKSLA